MRTSLNKVSLSTPCNTFTLIECNDKIVLKNRKSNFAAKRSEPPLRKLLNCYIDPFLFTSYLTPFNQVQRLVKLDDRIIASVAN
jgi:hypothetical protein